MICNCSPGRTGTKTSGDLARRRGPRWTCPWSPVALRLGQIHRPRHPERRPGARSQVFRLQPDIPPCGLRILALAAASDIGANTPIEFLLENSGAELATYYVVPGIAVPEMLPDHDVAIVIASPTEDADH